MKSRWPFGFRVFFGSLILCTGSLQSGIELKEGPPNPNDIQVVPVEKTPEPGRVNLRVQYPKHGKIEMKQPVEVEVRLDWFPLGVENENFDRRHEIQDSKQGQTIHVFIDNFNYFTVNEALFDALDDHDEFYDQIAEFKLPFKLSPGMHNMRAFPCRSFGESLKENNPSIGQIFYIEKTEPKLDVNLSAP